MIEKLKAERDIVDARIKSLKLERAELSEKISKIEWVAISWNDLKELLIKDYPENDYRKNPCVANAPGGYRTYCQITEGGDLQIGAYYHNDRFRRLDDLYIHYAKKPFG